MFSPSYFNLVFPGCIDMASTADDFSKYLDSLPAGADVFESLKATISMAAGSSALTNGLKGGALWSLVAAHAV